MQVVCIALVAYGAPAATAAAAAQGTDAALSDTRAVWTTIAPEGQVFNMPSSATVRYGAGTKWTSRSVQGQGQCTSTFFRRDPHVGVSKVCQAKVPAAAPAAASAQASWSPTEAELAALCQFSVERFQRYFPQGQLKARTGARDLIALALDAAASGDDPARIATTLQALQTLQDRNPNSSTYGNIHWYAGDTNLVDRNGVEFVVRHAGVLWLLYRDRLNPAALTALQEVLTLAKTGITRHNVAISYTNIHLMKTWNLVALGEGLGDSAMAAQGQKMLRDWLDWTARNGIAEYLSPDYYAVNLECLALIRNLSRDAETQRLAQLALDAVWSDAALHWYAPAQRLGATHSRDYSRLYNNGDFNALAARAGWPASSTRSVDPGPYGAWAWSPPSAAAGRWLGTALPRTTSTRWGEAAHQRHHHHLASDFSIGSSESGYNNMDTAPLAVSLGGGSDVPVITWTLDGRRDHYGLQRTVEAGSGHMKSLHLRPFIHSVQRGPEVLFLAHGAQKATTDDDALESTIVLPADARYWLDGRPLALFTHRSRWQAEPAANGNSTRFAIVKRGDRDIVELEDRDAGQGVGLSRHFAVSAGQQYRLRARVAGGSILLYLNFFDGQGKLIGAQRSQRVGGTAEERDYSFAQTAPAGAVRCQAWVYSSISNQALVALSDLSFEQVAADASVRVLGEYDFRVHQPQQVSVPLGSTLVVQRESAALALRLIDARNTLGSPITYTLHNDGLPYGAVRLTATHANSTTTAPASAVIWALARGGLDDGFDGSKAVAFRSEAAGMGTQFTLSGGVMDVTTHRSSAPPLRLRADLTNGLRLAREGGDPVPLNSARAVNGRDIGFVQP